MITLSNLVGRQAAWQVSQLNTRLNDSLLKLSSGYRFNKPSDAPQDYLKAARTEADIRRYDEIKTNLTEFKNMLELANNVAADIRTDVEDLIAIADTAGAEPDDTTRGLLQDDFDGLLDTVDNKTKTTTYNGETIFLNDVDYNEPMSLNVSVDGSETLSVDLDRLDVTTSQNVGIGVRDNPSRLDWSHFISGQTRAQGASFDLSFALTNIDNFISEASGLIDQLDSYINWADGMSEDLTTIRDNLMSIDVTEEMANYTALDVTQQAATAMITQANLSHRNVLQLYTFNYS